MYMTHKDKLRQRGSIPNIFSIKQILRTPIYNLIFARSKLTFIF